MARRVKSFGFGILAVLLLLGTTEVTLRLVISLSSDWLENREEITYEFKLWQVQLFDSFMGMHQPDPELFWKMKPGYKSALVQTNAMGFVGPDLPARERGELRVLFIGDSTPLGIGLADFHESFVFELQESLRVAYPERQVRVINAATAGYTSWQCRRQLELVGEQLQPDIVVTYFGNNDPSINGYLSDRELYDLSSRFGGVKRLLSRSYIYRALKLLILRLRSGSEENNRLQERVSVEQFTKNLAAVSAWCKGHGCDLVLCTVPTPDLWPPGIEFKVFSQGRDEKGRLVMSEQMRTDIGGDWALCLDTLLLPGRGDVWTDRVYAGAFTDKGDPVMRERFYRAQLAHDPENPKYLNNLAVALWEQHKSAGEYLQRALALDSVNSVILYNLGITLSRDDSLESRRYLERAKSLDHYSLRIKDSYNDALRRFAGEHQCRLAELDSLLQPLPDNQYFVDHCHPTTRGHKLIAGKLFERIAPLLAPGD